jgi:chloramphenicol 3-O-phosphotransferase
MARNVVCISHSTGAGGEEIGHLVADRLGFLYVDEEVIDRAARRAGIDPEQVADEERRKPLFAGLLDYLTEGDSQVIVSPPATAELRSEAVRAFIRNAIQEVAARGKAVIVAHAASYAVGAERRPLRVLVTASRETRAQRVGAAEGLEDLEAARLIKKSDAGRADYLKRFYGVAVELPIHYDLVINTDALSVEQAAALIAQAVA